MFNFTLHVCVCEVFHVVNVDVLAGVGAPPLDTTSEHAGLAKWGTCIILQWIHPKTRVF